MQRTDHAVKAMSEERENKAKQKKIKKLGKLASQVRFQP